MKILMLVEVYSPACPEYVEWLKGKVNLTPDLQNQWFPQHLALSIHADLYGVNQAYGLSHDSVL